MRLNFHGVTNVPPIDRCIRRLLMGVQARGFEQGREHVRYALGV